MYYLYQRLEKGNLPRSFWSLLSSCCCCRSPGGCLPQPLRLIMGCRGVMHKGNRIQGVHIIRRIKTEETAKVVVSVWGEEFIQFLTTLTILPKTILKNRMNSSFYFNSSWCNSSYN